MNYDGALVMPKNYAVVIINSYLYLIDENEMTYIDGGGVGQVVAYYTVKIGVNCAVMAFLGGGVVSCVKEAIRSIGTVGVKKAIVNALVKWVERRTANLIAGSIAGALQGFLSLSMGDAVAEWLDRHDGCNDNQIYFSRVRW